MPDDARELLYDIDVYVAVRIIVNAVFAWATREVPNDVGPVAAEVRRVVAAARLPQYRDRVAQCSPQQYRFALMDAFNQAMHAAMVTETCPRRTYAAQPLMEEVLEQRAQQVADLVRAPIIEDTLTNFTTLAISWVMTGDRTLTHQLMRVNGFADRAITSDQRCRHFLLGLLTIMTEHECTDCLGAGRGLSPVDAGILNGHTYAESTHCQGREKNGSFGFLVIGSSFASQKPLLKQVSMGSSIHLAFQKL